VYALDPAEGRVVWHSATGRRVEAAPLITDDVVYAVCHDHHLYALQTQTGERVWDFAATRRLEIAPVLSPDRTTLFIADQAGTVYAVQRPLTADELAQANRWSEAAEAYAAAQQPVKQAEALIGYARQLEQAQPLEQAAAISLKAR
jgi:hypothetical protein